MRWQTEGFGGVGGGRQHFLQARRAGHQSAAVVTAGFEQLSVTENENTQRNYMNSTLLVCQCNLM